MASKPQPPITLHKGERAAWNAYTKATGTVQGKALAYWRTRGNVSDVCDASGAVVHADQWNAAVPMPSLRRLAIALLPASTWAGHETANVSADMLAAMDVLPVGATELPTDGEGRTESTYWRSVAATAKALETSANLAGRPKATRQAKPPATPDKAGKGKGQAPAAPTAPTAPKPADIVRTTVAAVMAGRAVPGVTVADAKAIKAEVKAYAAAAPVPAAVDWQAIPADAMAARLRAMVKAGKAPDPALIAAARELVRAFGLSSAPTPATVKASA